MFMEFVLILNQSPFFPGFVDLFSTLSASEGSRSLSGMSD